MRPAVQLAAACVAVVLLTGSGAAGAEKRGRLILNGLFGPSSVEFDETHAFQEFVEDGSLRTRYKGDPGPGVDVGVQYKFVRHFGLLAGFSLLKRDEAAAYEAVLPHPLYFDRDRLASGDVGSLSYRERAFHVDLVAGGSTGSVDLDVFAGATFFKVESDLLDRVQYSHAYPFDSVTVNSVPAVRVEDSPVGFNVGGRVDFRVGSGIGLGAQVRFSRGRAELVRGQGERIELDAGGLEVGAGLRIFF